jgi:hypothetical protein
LLLCCGLAGGDPLAGPIEDNPADYIGHSTTVVGGGAVKFAAKVRC